MTTGNEGVQMGVKFIRWGLGLLIFGIFIGFDIIGHYRIGAQYNTGHMVHGERHLVVCLSVDARRLLSTRRIGGNDRARHHEHRPRTTPAGNGRVGFCSSQLA